MANRLVLCFALLCVTYTNTQSIPGGRNPADVDDENIQEMANFAVSKIDGGSNSMFRSKLMKLTKVETQVVAGMNYFMVFDMGYTTCRKGDETDLNSCEFKGKEVRECNVTVWDQPWTSTRRLTDFKCRDKPTQQGKKHPNHLVGGSTKMDHETKEAQDAANFAVEEMNAKTNSMYRLVLQDIISVHRQTVAGFKYKLVVKIGLSSCRNDDQHKHATLDECPLNENEETETCKFEVLHQAWQDPSFQLVKFKCEKSGKYHSKRHDARRHKNNGPKKHLLGGGDHDIGNFGMFSDFMKTFNKKYNSKAEEMRRFGIFRENMKKVVQLQRHEKASAKYGPTEFSDLSAEEFRKYYLTPQWDTSYDPSLKPATIPSGPIPHSFDWRDHDAVTPVKNQEQCGSCWAFSTTGNIEGQWAIRKQKLLSLSEQELVDCDKLDDGCAGGLPTNAYKEIIRLGGLETEGEYPYEAEGEKCKFKLDEARIYINSSVNITKNEADMAAWLAKNGPISIGINANAMQFYMGGVSHPWSFLCNPGSLDHGVLIVGYGVESGYFGDTPYWIVKNSWGKSWGEKGYYRVYRGDGTCGVNQMATSAVVE